MQRILVLRFALGNGSHWSIGLVDGNDVSHFNDALLIPCAHRLHWGASAPQRCPPLRDHDLRLPHTNGFHNDHIVARGLTQQQGLSGLRPHPKAAPAGEGLTKACSDAPSRGIRVYPPECFRHQFVRKGRWPARPPDVQRQWLHAEGIHGGGLASPRWSTQTNAQTLTSAW